MGVSIRIMVALAALAAASSSGAALAGGSGGYSGGGGSGCCKAPPPPPPPVSKPCCTPKPTGPTIYTPNVHVGGPNINVHNGGVVVGGTKVSVGGNVIVGGSSTLVVGGGGGGSFVIGGGGGGFYGPAPVTAGVIDGLELARAAETVTEMESEHYFKSVAIRAVCMDAKGTPHPASRPSGSLNVSDSFNGEIFRCMAGTYMEVTVGHWVDGKANFDGGKNISCTRGQALSYRAGELVCTAQTPQAACNERSLLRRFGPGIKVASIKATRQVERTRTVERSQTTVRSSMFIDGGVGQGVY